MLIPRKGVIGVCGLEQLSHSRLLESAALLPPNICLLSRILNCSGQLRRNSEMLFKLAWLLLCVLPLVALCAEDYYKVSTRRWVYDAERC